MDEAWYIVEQQIRDRLTEARAAARTRTVTQKLAPTTPRQNFVGITISRVANWVLNRAAVASGALTRSRQGASGDEMTSRERTPTMHQEVTVREASGVLLKSLYANTAKKD